MNVNGKAVRVEEVDFEIGQCPVCNKPVTGTAEVAIRLGALEAVGMVNGKAQVHVTATPTLRAMRVRHDCTATVTREAPA